MNLTQAQINACIAELPTETLSIVDTDRGLKLTREKLLERLLQAQLIDQQTELLRVEKHTGEIRFRERFYFEVTIPWQTTFKPSELIDAGVIHVEDGEYVMGSEHVEVDRDGRLCLEEVD